MANWNGLSSNGSWLRRPAVAGLVAAGITALAGYGAVQAANTLGLWTSLPASPTAHQNHSSTLLGDGTVLVAGGMMPPTPSGPLVFSRSTELFRPSTNDWVPVGNMAEGRAAFGAALAGNGKVVVAGGWQAVLNFTTGPVCGDGSRHDGIPRVEIYDPTTLGWTAGPSMSQWRSDFSLVRLNDGRVLAAGGSNSKSAEVYDPATNAWSYAGDMFSWRVNAAYTLMPDGRVMVAGGNADQWPYCSSAAEIYDPATNSWTATNPVSRIRAAATATVVRLADRSWRVLLAGGYDPQVSSSARVLSSAELYDPATNSWTATGSLNHARAFHTATLLTASGKVLVTGGENFEADPSDSNPVALAEIFDPVTLQWSSVNAMSVARRGHTATQLLIPFATQVAVIGGASQGSTPSVPRAELFQPTPLGSTAVLNAAGSCQPITLTASVASATGRGGPTGSVTFSDGPTTLGMAMVDSIGQASLILPPLPDGNHSFTAAYAGDNAFDTSQGALTLSINTPPSLTLSGPPRPTLLGVPITLTASVSGGTPPYSYAWDRDGVALSGGSTLADTPPLGVSRYVVTVTDAVGCSSITAVRRADVFDFDVAMSPSGKTLLRAGLAQDVTATITLRPGSSTKGLPKQVKYSIRSAPKDLTDVTGMLPFPTTSGGVVSRALSLQPGPKSLGDYAASVVVSAGGGTRSAPLGLYLFDYALVASPSLATGYRSGRPVAFALTTTVAPGSTAFLPTGLASAAAGLPGDATYVLPALPITGTVNLDVQPGPTSSGDFPFSVTGSTTLGSRLATATLRLLVDTTQPVITLTVNGTAGANGWYVSDVDVIWTVTDPESGVSTTGCAAATVTTDTAGTTFTCVATSDAGTTTRSVTIQRDTTPPVLSLPGNITLHQDQPGGRVVNYTATATDDVDPAPAVTCTPPSGSLFPVGTTTVTCQATNAAGLTAAGSFDVTIVP